MERILAFLLLIGTAAGAVAAVRMTRQTSISWVFAAFLVIAALPATFSLWAAVRRRARLAAGTTALAAAATGLLAIAFTRGRFNLSWPFASVLGLIAFACVVALFRRRAARVELALRQANSLLNQQQPDARAALAVLDGAECSLDDLLTIPQRAQFEWLSAVAQGRLHDLGRAITKARSALALYQHARQPGDARAVEKYLGQLGAKPGTTMGGAEGTLSAGFSRLVAASGLMIVVAAAFLFRMWAPPWAQLSMRGLFMCAATIAVWSAAVPWFVSKSGRPARAILALVLFSASLVGAGLAFAALMLTHDNASVAELPSPLHARAQSLLGWLSLQPGWLPAAALIAGLGLAVLSVIVLKGDSIAKLMVAVSQELRGERWDRALAILQRCDFKRERDMEVKASGLFELAFAHHMSNMPGEARTRLAELLECAPRHRAGLYLAGWLAFQANEIEEAESHWRQLHQEDPNYCPPEGGPQRTVCHLLSVALCRKAVQVMPRESELGANILAEVGRLGAMDESLSGLLIGIYCQRAAQFMRVSDWEPAGKELELGKDKLRYFKGKDPDGRDKKRLDALFEAGLGLVAFKLGRHAAAAKHLVGARAMVRDLLDEEQAIGEGDDLLAQLLRAAGRNRKSADSIAPVFARDTSFIAGIAQLHALHEQAERNAVTDWRGALALAKSSFQESLEVSPEFVDGSVMLGLLYCYGDGSASEHAKGLELLRKVCERAGSKFVAETVAKKDTAAKDRTQARDSYLQALQQYLRSASVPKTERLQLRDEVLDRMRTFGQEKSFMGRGNLDVDDERQHDPTIKEYLARAAMLRDKLSKLDPNDPDGNTDIKKLLEALESKSKELEAHARGVAEIEKELMQKAQGLLFN